MPPAFTRVLHSKTLDICVRRLAPHNRRTDHNTRIRCAQTQPTPHAPPHTHTHTHGPHLAVQAAGSQQRGVQRVGPVGGHQHLGGGGE